MALCVLAVICVTPAQIAARVMQAAGLCRYDSVEKCKRIFVDEEVCEACIRGWLMNKAKKELKEREGNG